MAVCRQQTTRIISGASFITTRVAYGRTYKTKIVLIEPEVFSYPGRPDAPRVHVRAGALGYFHSLNYQYLNLPEGADRVGGQLRGDKECPFSGVTKSGRVWRKVPESGV